MSNSTTIKLFEEYIKHYNPYFSYYELDNGKMIKIFCGSKSCDNCKIIKKCNVLPDPPEISEEEDMILKEKYPELFI